MLQAANEKRPRKPLLIVNPDTKAALVVPQTAPVAPVPTTTTTTTSVTRPVESRTDSGSVAPPVKTTENTIKVQDTFRRQVAEALGKPNDENSSNNLSVKAAAAPAPRAKSPTPVASSTSKESTTSQSSTLSDQASQAYPGIRTGNIPEEKVTTPTPATKVNVDETNKLVQIKPTVNTIQVSWVHFLSFFLVVSVLFCSFSRLAMQSARVVLSYVTEGRKTASQFYRTIAETFVSRTS